MAFVKGYKFTEEHRKNLSLACKGKPKSEEHKRKMSENSSSRRPEVREKMRLAKLGTKQSIETRMKRSKSMTDNPNNPWYKHGKTRREKNHYFDLEYRLWRTSVFERDAYTCQSCQKRGSEVYITAHHIKSWAKFPEFRYVINNGVTLCEECHKLTDNYKGKANKKL